MNENFQNLHPDKKKKIIDACINEFSENSYEKASTNSIVKNSGISKGTLFNYFGNKKKLFLYIFDYSMDYLIDRFEEMKCDQPSDLFDRLVWLSLAKMKLYLEHPLMSKFLVTSVINMPEELKDELSLRYSALIEKYTPPLLKDIDVSKFRSEISRKKAVDIVSIFLDALSMRYIKENKNKTADEIFGSLDIIAEEIYEYLEILKHGIYK
ncbi:fatty acid metabolism regulator protein [Oxobacter pfennigii]|uniref:Fatty acid metabolism regulator protein n=1 Tax=Oxobacter pfennigii TaxID=36849 RepID=A0A0P8WC85_9CLOT|nr:TetR/AcrR family transcriptional regulator [Oxobacter pfennigii]KPU45507.1 fatty acid metabolism regulator protein [Oxobacter pfennigii]